MKKAVNKTVGSGTVGGESLDHVCWAIMIIIRPTPYMNVMATTRGVFKAYAFLFVLFSHLLLP